MIENLPLFSVNVRVWKLCGFIEFQNYWRSCAFISVAVVMNLFVVLFFIENWENKEDLTLSFFVMAMLFNSIVRIVCVVVNQRDFVEFMENIVQWLKDTEERGDTEALEMLNGVTSKADKLSKFSFILGSSGSAMTALLPIILNRRDFPFPVWVPWIDTFDSPYYEIIFGVEVAHTIPFVNVAYIPFTNLYISWLLFGTASLQVLQSKLENLMSPSKTAEEIHAELAYCIQYHIKIIRLRDKLNAMLSLINLMEFLIFSLMLCFLLFYILITNSFWLKIKASTYILFTFHTILLFYWHANEFSLESLKIAEAAYNTDWTGCSTKLKKNILLIILRSQNSLDISVGGVYPMTLETFKSLLSASYSYFTVLKGMHQQ